MEPENALDRYLEKKAKNENSKPAPSNSSAIIVIAFLASIILVGGFAVGAVYLFKSRKIESRGGLEVSAISPVTIDQPNQRPETPIRRTTTQPAPAPSSPAAPSKEIWAKSYLGQKAPEFYVQSWITEEPNREGKFVLIDFWATWCPPCRELTPKLNAFHEKFGDKLVVIGVSAESKAKVEDYTRRNIQYYSAIDPARRMSRQYEVRGIPHVVLIDPEGVVRWEGYPLEETELKEEEVAAIVEG